MVLNGFSDQHLELSLKRDWQPCSEKSVFHKSSPNYSFYFTYSSFHWVAPGGPKRIEQHEKISHKNKFNNLKRIRNQPKYDIPAAEEIGAAQLPEQHQSLMDQVCPNCLLRRNEQEELPESGGRGLVQRRPPPQATQPQLKTQLEWRHHEDLRGVASHGKRQSHALPWLYSVPVFKGTPMCNMLPDFSGWRSASVWCASFR